MTRYYCFLLVLLGALHLPAQTATPEAKPTSETKPKPAPVAAPAIPSHKWHGITIQGSVRSRIEGWDWYKGEADNAYPFLGSQIRLSLSQSFDSSDWQLEFMAPILLGLPSNAVAAGAQGQLGLGANYFLGNSRHQNAANLFPKQAFYRWKNFGHTGTSLRLGRFEFNDGTELTPRSATLATLKASRISQRLIGSFGWTHVGRSFDGAQFQYNTPSANLTALAVIPTRGVFQTDGWGWTSTALGYLAYSKAYSKGNVDLDHRLFVIQYNDWRSVLKTDNRTAAARRADTNTLKIQTYGGHSLQAYTTPSGTIDLLFWGALQTGRWGTQSHRAGAIAVEAGYQPKVLPRLKPWLRAGTSYSTGDKNPNDTTHSTFFQILPTPRPFAKFPFFNLMNNRDVNASLILRPHKQWTINGEFHHLSLTNSNDLWYLGGGAFQPWSFGFVGRPSGGVTGLANLTDVSVDYRWKPAVTFSAYAGYSNGGPVIRTLYPKGKNGILSYLEVMYRF